MKTSLSSVFFIIILATFGCHVGTSGTWKNGNIKPDIKARIDDLNKRLFKSIVTKDAAGVKQLMSKVLIENSGVKIDTIINEVGNAMSTSDYDILDEYYTKNTTTNIPNTVLSANADNKDYTINYQALNEEMYTSVLVSKNAPVSFMILAIYGKYDNEWKLNILQIGEYKLLGKTAPDFYDEAQKLYNKGALVDAVDMIVMAAEIANPGGQQLKFKINDEMKDFYAKALKEANDTYKLPMTISGIKTTPQIFAVNPQLIDEDKRKGIYPVVKYKSIINLKDTSALKKENDALQKVIGHIFKGIDLDNKIILYQAVNQLPDGISMVKHYGFIQNIK